MFTDVQSVTLAAVTTGLVMASGVVWSMTRPPPPILKLNADYHCHSILVDRKTLTRTSQFKLLTEIRVGDFRDIKTLYDAFQCGLSHGRNEPCLGYIKPGSKEYVWMTFSEVDELSVHTGAGIIHRLKQLPGQNTRIGIFMKNCAEWVYIEQSCNRYSTVAVPLYDTLGEESCIFIINKVRCEVLFVDTAIKVNFLLENKYQLPSLKYIVCVHDLEKEIVKKGSLINIDILDYSEILKAGQDNPHVLQLCKPEDISSVFFTSGTTGTPKGCLVTHAALMTTIRNAILHMKESTFGHKKETHLSFLPLTHAYERLVHILMFMFTGKIALYSGDIRNLVDEMKIIRPTIIFAVPRLLNRIYDKVLSQINKSKITKIMYNRGLAYKMEEVQRGIIRKNSIWDYILFRKIQALLGGRTEIMLVGSAPVSSTVADFFRAVMGTIFIEGYGQTETAGAVTLTLLGDCTPGQVGPPVAGVLIKLTDVPELDIIVSRDEKGEICVKGPCCISEYFENEEMTSKLIDSEGWLHTGDVGQWTEKGQLKIVDRCKHIFKLSQGEYLAPEKLENVYGLSELVSQIFVTGNSLKDYCVAIVVPELEGWQTLEKPYTSVKEICEDKDSVEILLRNLEVTGRQKKLMGFEIVKKVYLWPELMTVENGFLTPTYKLRRIEIVKFFKNRIDNMYS